MKAFENEGVEYCLKLNNARHNQNETTKRKLPFG